MKIIDQIYAERVDGYLENCLDILTGPSRQQLFEVARILAPRVDKQDVVVLVERLERRTESQTLVIVQSLIQAAKVTGDYLDEALAYCILSLQEEDWISKFKCQQYEEIDAASTKILADILSHRCDFVTGLLQLGGHVILRATRQEIEACQLWVFPISKEEACLRIHRTIAIRKWAVAGCRIVDALKQYGEAE